MNKKSTENLPSTLIALIIYLIVVGAVSQVKLYRERKAHAETSAALVEAKQEARDAATELRVYRSAVGAGKNKTEL